MKKGGGREGRITHFVGVTFDLEKEFGINREQAEREENEKGP